MKTIRWKRSGGGCAEGLAALMVRLKRLVGGVPRAKPVQMELALGRVRLRRISGRATGGPDGTVGRRV